MNEMKLTKGELRKVLHKMGIKRARLPKNDRTLFLAMPDGFTVWRVTRCGDDCFVVEKWEPPAKHDFTETSFRLHISLDTLPARPYEELAALLRQIADRVEQVNEKNDLPGGGWIQHYQTIHDARGNDVGRFAIKPTSEE